MTPLLSATLLRTQSDARLVALAQQGHERAFEAIVERYRRPLHRHLRRMLNESRAEDALQQTCVKAWSALEEGAEIHDLKPWLYRIAHNTALDALKKAGYDYDELTESLRAPSAPEADAERRAVIRETLAGVAALPGNQREALLRTAVEGQSRAQVASDLGVSDGAVRQLLHRARTTLRAAATAATPMPVAGWAAGAAGAGGLTAERVGELVAGGGAGLLFKGGAVLVAAGALVTAPVALHGGSARDDPGVAAAAASAPARPGDGPAPAADRTPGSTGDGDAASAGENGGGGQGGSTSGQGRRGGGSGSEGTGSGDDHGTLEGERTGVSGGDDHGGSGTSVSGGDHGGSSTSVSGDEHGGSVTSGSGSGESGSGGSGEGVSGGGSGSPEPSSSGPGSGTTTTTTTTTEPRGDGGGGPGSDGMAELTDPTHD